MKQSLDTVLQAVDACQDTILAAEQHIWNNPETGFREWKTHAYLKAQYEELGYTVTEAGNIPGFWTDVDTGRPGPCIAVFGELDALIIPAHPACDSQTGAVHACGHHCQSAALLGVAAALKTPGVLDNLSGTIRLIAVPAEESEELDFRKQLKKQGVIRYLTGKQEFMARGVLDGVDISIMVHTATNESGLICGAGANGVILKEATFLGTGAHSAGSPHMGINALYAATCAVQAVSSIRETFPDADHIRFHPIITKGGEAISTISDRVVVESYIAAASLEALFRENPKLNRAFAGAAAAMGANVKLEDLFGYAPLFHEPALKELCRQVGVEVLGEALVNFSAAWDCGCTDMGDVSCVMPALQPEIGGATGTDHSIDYSITDHVMACINSAKVQCAMLVRLLENEGAEAKRILAESRQDYPTIPEYLAQIDALCMDKQAVVYDAERSAHLTF